MYTHWVPLATAHTYWTYAIRIEWETHKLHPWWKHIQSPRFDFAVTSAHNVESIHICAMATAGKLLSWISAVP